jgi:hypothetical protein
MVRGANDFVELRKCEVALAIELADWAADRLRGRG